jgi:hypothetical protein
MKRLISGMLFGFVFILSGSIAFAGEQKAVESPKPSVVISGADSHVKKPRYLRITSRKEWAKAWQEHKGEKITDEYDYYYDPLTLPAIDFDKYMVIAVFQGESANNAGLEFDSMIEKDEQIQFKYLNRGYQTMGHADDVVVYGFFVVARSAKPVLLIEGTRTMDAGKIRWEEKTTLPKL